MFLASLFAQLFALKLGLLPSSSICASISLWTCGDLKDDRFQPCAINPKFVKVTAATYGQESGMRVVEVNTGDRAKGTTIEALIGEAMQSSAVQSQQVRFTHNNCVLCCLQCSPWLCRSSTLLSPCGDCVQLHSSCSRSCMSLPAPPLVPVTYVATMLAVGPEKLRRRWLPACWYSCAHEIV